MVDEMSPIALYIQLANLLEARIKSGEFPPRKPIPSEPHIQQEYGVSRGTVRAALRLLRERGLVVTMPARGTYVAEKKA
ncbi:GntR family transcriptional regulator [Micromonospora sp. DT233]|uniref:GntR family transcriptional regulator n=1 Tax=Micromonospora sp. DT233 TaxID=3393432 RepID=UPI003CF1E1E4